MELLSTEQGLGALASATDVGFGAHAGLLLARSLFDEDLRHVEAELADVDGEEPARSAVSHLAASGGKRVRALSVLLTASCFGPVKSAAREMAVVAEMVHAATLLHDDVIDDGDQRRGVPTARRMFGNAVSVLAGDLLLTHALDRTARQAPQVLPELLVTLRRLVDGEVLQLRGRTVVDLSASMYERIVLGKTASLFGWSSRAGARLGGASAPIEEAMSQFGEHLGVAFQLVDDVLDYEGADTGKTLLADLHEGKVTLPLALAAARDGDVLGLVARVRAGDEEAAARVAAIVKRSGVCEDVRARARESTECALELLRRAPGSLARDLLQRVAEDLTARAALL